MGQREQQIETGYLCQATRVQQAFWLAQCANAEVACSSAALLHLQGRVDKRRLEQVVAGLLARYPALHTRFGINRGCLYANPAPYNVAMPILQCEAVAPGQLLRRALALVAKPYDLAQGPLWRFHLLQRAPRRAALLLCLHLSIADSWSRCVLLQALAAGWNVPAARRRGWAAWRDEAWLAHCQQLAPSWQPDAVAGALCREPLAESSTGRASLCRVGRERPPLRLRARVFCIAPVLRRQVLARCTAEQLSPLHLLLCALRFALRDCLQLSAATVAVALDSRQGAAQEHSIGSYTRLALAHASLEPDERPLQALRRLQAITAAQLEQMPSALSSANRNSNNDYDMLFHYQEQPLATLRFNGLEHRLQPLELPLAPYPLRLEIQTYRGGWRLLLGDADALFPPTLGRHLLSTMARRLRQLTQDH